jgi:hypothetical protein
MGKLYFVKHDDDLGCRCDLHVSAPSPEGAVMLWREYFELPENAEPDQVFEIALPRHHGAIEGKVCQWIS